MIRQPTINVKNFFIAFYLFEVLFCIGCCMLHYSNTTSYTGIYINEKDYLLYMWELLKCIRLIFPLDVNAPVNYWEFSEMQLHYLATRGLSFTHKWSCWEEKLSLQLCGYECVFSFQYSIVKTRRTFLFLVFTTEDISVGPYFSLTTLSLNFRGQRNRGPAVTPAKHT